MAPDDLIQPFQVEGPGLRGRLVRLGPALDTILTRHDYPEPVARLLAEALTLAALLASALKFDGIFTLQTKGDGPVGMMVTDFRSPGDLRGYAAFEADKLPAQAGILNPVPRLIGAGYLAFTVDQGEDMERYQGIVELNGATMAECAHAYFRQSEQLQTGIKIAVGRDGDGKWRAGGLMLQRLPPEGGKVAPEHRDQLDDEDDWRRALILLASARDDELTAPLLPPRTLLWRLFHEDGVRVYDPVPLRERCRCSAERIQPVLRGFSIDDLEHMTVDGRIGVTCEFCNTTYTFAPGSLDFVA